MPYHWLVSYQTGIEESRECSRDWSLSKKKGNKKIKVNKRRKTLQEDLAVLQLPEVDIKLPNYAAVRTRLPRHCQQHRAHPHYAHFFHSA